jgi:hypothetical protein
MPTVEIDEAEYRRFQTLGRTVSTILSNPKAKRLVQQAHKMVDANAVTPELDQEQVVAEPLTALRKEFSDFVAETKKEAAEREARERVTALRNQEADGIAALRRQGWTDDGIAGVKKMMDEKGLLDPLDAAAIYEKAHPPQTPAAPSGQGAWNFAEGITDDQADIKKLLDTKGSNDLVVENMARGILNEVRAQSRR